MRADLYGDVKVGRFRAAGSIGYIPQGDLTASLTTGVDHNEEGSWLLRGGRINLPFGIRMIEHTLWARTLTRTDMDASQQYGVSLAVSKENFRGELMGIAGNFEIQQDEFRERGYCGYFEYAPTTTLAVG